MIWRLVGWWGGVVVEGEDQFTRRPHSTDGCYISHVTCTHVCIDAVVLVNQQLNATLLVFLIYNRLRSGLYM